MNVIDACIDKKVKKVIALSTDKACKPVNLYGATKLASDKLFIAANSYSGEQCSFSVVRYGNVMGSRGSIIPLFHSLRNQDSLPITDKRMTRFMITLDIAVELVWQAFEDMVGGEIYVKKIPSMKVTDIAKTIAPNVPQKIIGIRPGEKLHEEMISSEDSDFTYEYNDYFKILPQINDWFLDNHRIKTGIKVPPNFSYDSFQNTEWMNDSELNTWINENIEYLGKI